ncbi:MAG: cob(I)yrinic acid a,c-diamide adenosyltransferase [bacterium]
MEKKGLIQIYTGDGKGKTTASIGQAIRAKGHKFKVCFVYFFKNLKDFHYGEVEVLKGLGIEIVSLVPRHPHFYKNIPPEGLREECLKALESIKEIFEKNYDMIILDEILIALRDRFLKEEEILQLLEKKPESLEIILTGRGATRKIIERAALVTEMKKIKHPFHRGVKERRGIEY